MKLTQKLILFSTVLFLTLHSAYAQKRLKFERLSPMPVASYAFGYSQSEDKIFTIGGADENGLFGRLQMYNAKINLWMNLPLKDFPMVKYPSAIYIEDYNALLVAGGITPYGSNVALVEQIRLIGLDKYQTAYLGRLPQGGKNLAMAYGNNTVHFFGGALSVEVDEFRNQDFTFSNNHYSYNLKTGVFKELPDLPIPMKTNGGIIDDKLYVFGGFNGHSLANVWQYDIEKESWAELSPLKYPISANAITQYQQYFIIVGDFFRENQIIVYNTETQSAQYFKGNFSGRYLGASVVGEYLHVYGGSQARIPTFQHSRIHLNEVIQNSMKALNE